MYKILFMFYQLSSNNINTNHKKIKQDEQLKLDSEGVLVTYPYVV